MISLPRSLACLSDVTTEHGRYAMKALRAFDYDEGRWRVDATDGHILVIAQGLNLAGAESTPPEFESRDIRREYLIPAEKWDVAFKMAPPSKRPADQGIQWVCDDERNLTAFTLEGRVEGQAVDGRFPDVMQCLPRSCPTAIMTVDVKQLMRLLRVINKVLGDKEGRAVLHYYGPGLPLAVLAKNSEGTTIDSLIVPIDGNPTAPPPEPEEPAAAEPFPVEPAPTEPAPDAPDVPPPAETNGQAHAEPALPQPDQAVYVQGATEEPAAEDQAQSLAHRIVNRIRKGKGGGRKKGGK